MGESIFVFFGFGFEGIISGDEDDGIVDDNSCEGYNSDHGGERDGGLANGESPEYSGETEWYERQYDEALFEGVKL